MEVRGEAEITEDDTELPVDSKKVVYVLHPNCNVEALGGAGAQETQAVDS